MSITLVMPAWKKDPGRFDDRIPNGVAYQNVFGGSVLNVEDRQSFLEESISGYHDDRSIPDSIKIKLVVYGGGRG